MRNYIGYIIDYADRNLTDRKRKWFESELIHNNELRAEYNLFKQVNDSMRGKQDIDEVLSDPNRNSIDTLSHQMVADFHANPDRFKTAKGFIHDSLSIGDYDHEIQEDLNKVSEEADNLKINSITKDWVNEWNVKKQTGDTETNSRRAFINSSLKGDDILINNSKPKRNYSFAIRLTSYAAAALIAIFLVIYTLIPTNSPGDLYQEFYKPLNANVSMTRTANNIIDPFSSAVEKYKQGQYQIAGTMFSDLIFEDPNNIAYRFFSGITQIELGDYEQSIILLNEVISKNGEFKKEAQWYLGLIYLKSGNVQKATPLINELSQSKGYYQDQAQYLLNRIK